MSLEAVAHFSLSLLQQSNVEESVVISPLSVALAFAMIHAGAGGKSKEEICQVIAKDASDEQLLEYYKSVSEDLLKNSKVKVKLANRIYIKESFKLNETYIDKIKNNFDATAVNLDFRNGKKCSKIVNDFVEEATAGKIKDIVTSHDFPESIFVLINAIYFEGEWDCPFSSEGCKRDFYVKEGVTKNIDFMSLKGLEHDYVETDEVQVLSKSYKDETFNFVVVLPKKQFGLVDIRKNFTAEKLLDLMSRFHPHKLNILMPKFKIETTTPLVDLLKRLGISEVFTCSANLSDIAAGVHISDARHKAFIEVDEKGTKAAAATAVIGINKKKPPRRTLFIADHPFLFFLAHKKNILFCGQYNA